MKHEPLKNKKINIIHWDTFEHIIHYTNKGEFLKICDIRSAIEGYKNSLQKHLEEAENSLSTEGYFDGYIDGIQRCLNEIDKWFEDVIK